MTSDVDAQLRDLFSAVLGCEPSRLREEDTPQTVAGWDSINHMQLLLAVEDAFGMQFSPEEFASLTSFGALRRRIESDEGRPTAR